MKIFIDVHDLNDITKYIAYDSLYTEDLFSVFCSLEHAMHGRSLTRILLTKCGEFLIKNSYHMFKIKRIATTDKVQMPKY